MASPVSPSPAVSRANRLAAVRNIAELRDLEAGHRCFIVATGPSLGKVPLGLLAGDFVIGVNRAYVALGQGLPHIDILVVADPAAYHTYHEELEAAPAACRLYRSNVHALVTAKGHDPRRSLSYPFHMEPWMDEGCFAKDLTAGTYRGATVVLEAVQVAYYMGCSEVYVLGCDLDYSGAATHFYAAGPHEEASRTVMPIDRARKSMAVAKSVYDADGRVLLNATAGGALEEIGRVDFLTLFNRTVPLT
jgi:hypothetical protein